MVLAIAPCARSQAPQGAQAAALGKVEPPPPASIAEGQWEIGSLWQESEGKVHKLHSIPEGGGTAPFQAWVESSTLLVRADEIEWDEETGDVHASGRVYFHNFKENEELWCDHLEYNTDRKAGRFDTVRGQITKTPVPRPGVLTSASPFYFQGEWAERVENEYILHNGFITNCKMPSPWWRLRGPRFAITPGEKALAYHTVFLLRGVPLFYTPYFYHSLEKEPRKSGFLMPNFGNSSKRGILLGAGYYWAINRSYDITYRLLDYTSRGYAHHLDFRGNPRKGTDFYAIVYGVQDRGRLDSKPPDKYSGFSVYAVGKSDLGRGWTAHSDVNYITSFRFRQEWSESYNERIGGEIASVAFIDKNFSTYTFDGVFSRLQNFQTEEIPVSKSAAGDNSAAGFDYIPNVVTIRKLPEANFSGRDRQFRKLPFWLSFDSSAGLLTRSQPVFQDSQLIDKFQTGPTMNRVSFAPRAIMPLHFGYLHLIPSLGLRETYYSEGQTPYQDRYRPTGTNIVRSARDFSLDIVFPSLERVFQKKTFLGDKLKHVIEPRATYQYVTGIGRDFNDFIRFDETDLLSNTNELLLSLTNRVYAKRGDSVQEVLTWTVMQKRYFDPTFGGALLTGQRNVFASTADLAAFAFLVGPRSASPVVSSLRISPAGGLGVRWQSDYDPRMRGIVDSILEIEYRWKLYFLSGSNNEVHPDPALAAPQNQYGFRGGFGDANRRGLNMVVYGRYDYRNSFLQELTVTASYNTDCCGLSFQYYDNSNGLRRISGWRYAFAIANIGTTFGTLRKQDRMF